MKIIVGCSPINIKHIWHVGNLNVSFFFNVVKTYTVSNLNKHILQHFEPISKASHWYVFCGSGGALLYLITLNNPAGVIRVILCCVLGFSFLCLCWCVLSQMEYERQVASVRAQNALEGDFSISQAEMSSRQAMLENASDIKVAYLLQSPEWMA